LGPTCRCPKVKLVELVKLVKLVKRGSDRGTQKADVEAGRGMQKAAFFQGRAESVGIWALRAHTGKKDAFT